MPNYFHTKSFYIFVGLFELLLGLYYLIFGGDCPIPSCSPLQHITLAKILILAGTAALSVSSFHKNYALHFFLSFFASFPLFLLSIPFLATHLFLEAIPLGLMAIGLLVAPFLPKNAFSQKESFLLTIIISLILIISSPLFSLFFPVALLSGVLLLIYSFREEKSPFFPIFAGLSFQAFLIKGITQHSPILILLSILALASLLVFQVIKKSYSIKSSLKNLPVYKKIAIELESLSWVSIFIMLLTIIQSQLVSPPFHLPYILISILSIFIVIYFNLLPQNFYNEKNLALAVNVYNVLLLLIILATNGLASPLIFLLIIPLLITAVYLPKSYIFLPLAINIEFFINFTFFTDIVRNSLVSLIFTCSLFTLIALIIYKTLETKDIFLKKHDN